MVETPASFATSEMVVLGIARYRQRYGKQALLRIADLDYLTTIVRH
jgi:hypothetical protein